MLNKKVCLRVLSLTWCILLMLHASAQTRKVSGKVLSEDNITPLQGAVVVVKGKPKTTTQTAADGTFSIQASDADILVISFVGYGTQQVFVTKQSLFSITLKQEATKMDEVVVVGYGTQSRRTLTGSVASLDQNVLKSSPNSNLGTALEGTIPGLRVQQSTGQPGSTPSISFRGGSNFDGTGSPLIVVDGVVLTTVYGLNMDDVETIDLLKDAGSLAIYGARAANGVLLITTKKGKKGKTQASYSYKNTTNYIRYNATQYLSPAQYIHWNRNGIESYWEGANADNSSAGVTVTNANNQLVGGNGWSTNPGNSAQTSTYTTQLVNTTNRQYIGQPGWSLLVDPNPFTPGKTDSILYRGMSQRQI